MKLTQTERMHVFINRLPVMRRRLERFVENANVAFGAGVLGPPVDSLHVVRAVVESVEVLQRAPVGDEEDSVAFVWGLGEDDFGSAEDCAFVREGGREEGKVFTVSFLLLTGEEAWGFED